MSAYEGLGLGGWGEGMCGHEEVAQGDLCGDRGVPCLDCGAGYTNLHT